MWLVCFYLLQLCQTVVKAKKKKKAVPKRDQNNCLQIANQSNPKIVHAESSGKSGVILFHLTGQIGSHYSTMVQANNGMFFILTRRLHSQTFTAIKSWNLFPIWHSAIFLILLKVSWYIHIRGNYLQEEKYKWRTLLFHVESLKHIFFSKKLNHSGVFVLDTHWSK